MARAYSFCYNTRVEIGLTTVQNLNILLINSNLGLICSQHILQTYTHGKPWQPNEKFIMLPVKIIPIVEMEVKIKLSL
jgi:hypothetical protein